MKHSYIVRKAIQWISKSVLPFLLFFILCGSLFARPRIVNLEKELRGASFMGLFVIDNYDDKGNVYFHSLDNKDSVHKAAFGSFGKIGLNWKKPNAQDWTGFTPAKKDTVLIVLDSNKHVSLFARPVGLRYRFWSPYFTGNKAMFLLKEPAELLEGKRDLKGFYPKEGEGLHVCEDGCWLPKDALEAYRKK